MIRIEDTIFSLDLLEKKFKCDLINCHGNCCRYGDSGAPLTQQEVVILAKIFPLIRNYLRPEGLQAIEEKGTSTRDFENDNVTPLIKDAECAYTIKSGEIFMCAIEKAWNDGKINFRKPLSCHLFPARIKQFSDFRAVNYQALEICSAARDLGAKEEVYLYKFLEEPLRRAVGDSIYNDLCIAAGELERGKR